MWFIKQTVKKKKISPFSNFYGEIWMGFCLKSLENAFFRGFILKPTERAQFLVKKIIEIFNTALLLRDRYVFMSQSVKRLNIFNTLTLKQIFWKGKTFFRKLEYSFLVKNTKIENASFPFKTAMSGANVKARHIKKSRVLPVTALFFRKFCFSLRTSYAELI